jgi:hypothetical protein
MESLLAPDCFDRAMLETWRLGNTGYWGPPGVLPPPGLDGRAPLLARVGRTSRSRRPVFRRRRLRDQPPEFLCLPAPADAALVAG